MPSTDNFIEQLTKLGKQILPPGSSMWLYGSRARGTAHAESDWDLLILLDKNKRTNEDFEAYSAPLMDFGFEHGELVMPHMYTYQQWEKYSFTPFEKNVEQDKIVLV